MARKYREGKKFKSPKELFNWLYGGNHIYARGKFVHNGWARSWQINYLINAFRTQNFRQAIRNEPKDAPHLGLIYEMEKGNSKSQSR